MTPLTCNEKIGLALFAPLALFFSAMFLGWAGERMTEVLRQARGQQCVFDRNEIGPMSAHGQWWYDVYKCPDGTERRVLVAGPRG